MSATPREINYIGDQIALFWSNAPYEIVSDFVLSKDNVLHDDMDALKTQLHILYVSTDEAVQAFNCRTTDGGAWDWFTWLADTAAKFKVVAKHEADAEAFGKVVELATRIAEKVKD